MKTLRIKKKPVASDCQLMLNRVVITFLSVTIPSLASRIENRGTMHLIQQETPP